MTEKKDNVMNKKPETR